MATKINIDNYEAFLLDYMEGNLNKEDTLLLQQFVVLHPELNIDLNELELVELSEEIFKLENKISLKKTTTDLVSEEQFVNYIENTLTADEKHKIERLAATHPEVNKELTLYKKTILTADASIVFENKSVLKKETKVIWLFSRQTLSIAAAILLVFGFWILFKFYTPTETAIEVSNNLTKTTNSVSPQEEISKQEELVTKLDEEVILNVNKKNNLVAAVTSKKEKVVAVTKTTSLTAVAINTTTSGTITETISAVSTTSTAIIKEIISPAKATKVNNTYIITEKAYDEDENTLIASNEKGGFWSKAKKALNGLNKLGVKAVNGTEASQSNSEQYVLSVGNFSLENNKYNKE